MELQGQRASISAISIFTDCLGLYTDARWRVYCHTTKTTILDSGTFCRFYPFWSVYDSLNINGSFWMRSIPSHIHSMSNQNGAEDITAMTAQDRMKSYNKHINITVGRPHRPTVVSECEQRALPNWKGEGGIGKIRQSLPGLMAKKAERWSLTSREHQGKRAGAGRLVVY